MDTPDTLTLDELLAALEPVSVEELMASVPSPEELLVPVTLEELLATVPDESGSR